MGPSRGSYKKLHFDSTDQRKCFCGFDQAAVRQTIWEHIPQHHISQFLVNSRRIGTSSRTEMWDTNCCLLCLRGAGNEQATGSYI